MSASKEMVSAPDAMLPGLVDEKHSYDLAMSFQIEQVGFGPISLDRLPTTVERQILQKYNAELQKRLKPYGMGQMSPPCLVRRSMAVMFNGFPRLSKSDVADLLDAYMMVLQKYPQFAILGAIDDVVNHRGFDPRFEPTSPQMAQAAMRRRTPDVSMQYRVNQILKAKLTMRPTTYKPGARDRVAASLRDFKGRINPDVIAGGSPADHAARLEADAIQRAHMRILRQWSDLGIAPMYREDFTILSVDEAKAAGMLRDGRGGPDA